MSPLKSSSGISLAFIVLLLCFVWCTNAHNSNNNNNKKLTKERIIEWHDKLYESTNALNSPGGGSSGLRGWAIMVLAMFDAVNAIDPEFRHYLVAPNSVPESLCPGRTDVKDAEPLAAAAKAAQVVLDWLFPTSARKYAHLAQFVTHVGPLGKGSRTTCGIAVGEFVAQKYITARTGDGHPPLNYPQLPVVNGTNWDQFQFGVGYAPLPGNPISVGYPAVRPFALSAYGTAGGAVAYVPPPPSRTSDQFFEEWKVLFGYGTQFPGNSTNTTTAADIARFHDGNFGSQIGWVIDVLSTSGIEEEGLDLLRILALTSMSSHDAHANHWFWKYTYLLARPITAYRQVPANLARLGAYRDPNWRATLTTGITPEYPSGHACRTGGVTASFRRAFGDVPPGGGFSTTSFSSPNLGSRSYTSFSEFQSEVQISRTYGGVHWLASGNAGRDVSQRVTNYVWENYLKPLSGRHGHNNDDDDDD